MSRTLSAERRRHRRTAIPGSALVKSDQGWASYALDNLSAGGAQLRGEPQLRTGQTVRLVLDAPEIPAEEIVGRVIWHAAGEPACCGIAFLSLDAEIEGYIEETVLAALSGRRRRHCG